MKELNSAVLNDLWRRSPYTTRKKFAEDVGISESNITKYLRGEIKNVSDENFEKIAKYFQMSADELNILMLTNGKDLTLDMDASQQITKLEKDKQLLKDLLDLANKRLLRQDDDIDRLRQEVEKLRGQISEKKSPPLSESSVAINGE